MKSTSIHSLNADTGLNHLEKVAYLFLNFINNLFPYWHVDRRIKFRQLEWENLSREWENTYPDSSPARKLSDLFWRTLPWLEIKKELGEIHVFDTGCGHGNYSMRLWSGTASYTGVDAKRRPNWAILEKEHSNFNFIESVSTDILPLIPKETNLFITQSAIEHFDQDILFFEQIRSFIEKANHPVMQIHLFPGGATLPLYLFHGLRQYTPRTISKITKLFGNDFNFTLYGLGGKASSKLHFKYFTWPVLIARKYSKPTFDKDVYDKELETAVKRDIQQVSDSPLFWALVIHSNPKTSRYN